MFLEPLEQRHLLATLFVNDNWNITADNDNDNLLSLNDEVNNINDVAGAPVTATFGVDAFDRIQDAVDAAASGDQIVVLDGTYAENVVISTDNLTLSGHTGIAADAVIDGNAADVLTISANDVTVSDLRVTNGGAGIHVTAATNFTANNVQSDTNAGDGLLADSVTLALTITDSTFTANQNGLHLTGSGAASLLAISGIVASANAADGLSTDGWAAGIAVSDSTFNDNAGDGIGIANTASDVVFVNVTATGNDPGLLIDGAASFSDTDGNYSDNADHGIQLIDIAGDVTLVRTTANNNDADDDDTGDGVNAIDGGDADSLAIGGMLTVSGATFQVVGAGNHQRNGLVALGVGTSVTFQPAGAIPVTAAENELDGVRIDGFNAATFTGGSYTSNGGSGVNLTEFAGTISISEATLSDNADRGFVLENAATQGTVSLSDLNLENNGSGFGGRVANVVSVDFTTTSAPAGVEDTVAIDDVQFQHTRGATAHQPVGYSGVDQLTVNTGNGADTVNIASTLATTDYVVNAGAGSDTVNVGDAADSLDGILGEITVNGDGHDAGDASISVTCDGDTVTNTLDTGDVLNLHDQGNAAGHTYTITGTTVDRDGMAQVTYGTVESLNVDAGTNQDTFDVTTTAASVNTTLNTTDGGDTVNVTTTGASSNLTVNGDGGVNAITIQNTGNASGMEVNAAGGSDTITLAGNGAGSAVRLNGDDGTDTIDLRATSAGSLTEVNGGANSDTVNVGSAANSLDGIQGKICANGDGHDAGDASISVTCDGDTVTNTLDTGDVLNLHDQGNATGHTYTITGATVDRDGMARVTYGTVESLSVDAGTNQDTFDVTTTAASVNTTLNTTDGGDTVNVTATGASSNLTVNGDGGVNAITIQTTGDASGTEVNAAGGSDTITLAGNGAGSAVRLNGDDGTDTIDLRATSAGSLTEVNGGANSDTVNVGSAANSLDDIQGKICVNGDGHDAAAVSSLGPIKTDTNTLVVGDQLTLNDASSATGHVYDLSASTFVRSGTARLTYATTETIQLTAASSGGSTINIASTVSGGTTTVSGGTGIDTVSVTTTGADSNVSISTGGGADEVVIALTGGDGPDADSLASFLVVNGGDELVPEGDRIALMNTAVAGRVQLNGQAGRDTIEAWATALSSALEIFGGDHNDTIHIGNPAAGQSTLDNIQGEICADGGSGESTMRLIRRGGTVNATTPFFTPGSAFVAVDDKLILNDADSTGNRGYSVSADSVQVGVPAVITFSTMEVARINGGLGNDDFTADMDAQLNVIQADGGAGGDNRFSALGGGEISIRDINAPIGARFEIARMNSLIVTGSGGADTIDNQSATFGELDGGDGNDVINSVVSSISGVNSFGETERSVLTGGAGADTLVVGGSAFSEVQRVGFSSTASVTGGTFALTFDGQTTAPIPFNASAAIVRSALEALSNVGIGDVSVAKVLNTASAQTWQVAFQGALGGANVVQMLINVDSLVTAGVKSKLETTPVGGQGNSSDVIDRGSTFLVGDRVSQTSPAQFLESEPGDRYLSSASVAGQVGACNGTTATGAHTVVSNLDDQVNAIQGPFSTIAGTKLKLTVVQWLQACLDLRVTQKQINNLLEAVRRQVADFESPLAAAPIPPMVPNPEGDSSIVVNPFHNPFRSTDVNDDGKVSPSDALAVINRLNSQGIGELSPPAIAEGESLAEELINQSWVFYDVSGDGSASPRDALLVINELNAAAIPPAVVPEGESDAEPAPPRSGDTANLGALADSVSNRQSGNTSAERSADDATGDDAAAIQSGTGNAQTGVSQPAAAANRGPGLESGEKDDDEDALFGLLASDWQDVWRLRRDRRGN